MIPGTIPDTPLVRYYRSILEEPEPEVYTRRDTVYHILRNTHHLTSAEDEEMSDDTNTDKPLRRSLSE